MATKFLDLEDRIITDAGDVIFKDKFFWDRAGSKEAFDHLRGVKSRELDLYNLRFGETRPNIECWEDDGEVTGPADETYDWVIPQEYQELNIVDLAIDALGEKTEQGAIGSGDYANRLMDELDEMRTRGMFPFVRCLLYVRDKFREQKVVWGVGRGSSCACLVLYLLDINRVDPIKYEIPKEEFFKPT